MLRRLAPLLACFVSAPMAILIGLGAWEVVFLPLVIAASIVICYSPLGAILIWILIFPYFVRAAAPLGGSIVYWGLHRIMIMAALAFAVLQVLHGSRPKPKWYAAELVMLSFLGFMIGSIVIRSDNPVEMLRHFFDRLFVPFAMYFLIRFLCPTERELRQFIPVALITIGLQATIGTISWFAPSFMPGVWRSEGGDRVVGSFANPATYTSTLIFLSAFLFNAAMTTKRSLPKTVYLLAVALTFFCVFISFSRGSWLGGFLVLLGLCLVYPRLIIISTLLMALFISGLGWLLFSRELDFASQRLQNERTAEGRIITSAGSVRMIAARPLFGWGYGTYDEHVVAFRGSVGDIPAKTRSTSHNTYLTMMAEDGVIAFILYVTPIGWLFVRSLRVWKKLPRDGFPNRRWLALLWLCVLDHVAVSSFMDMIRFNLFGTSIFWMILALIACVVYPSKNWRKTLS